VGFVVTRTYLITGSASGIGRATFELLTGQGHRVIGVDLHDAEVVADLATAAGRAAMVERVNELTDGVLDAVVANAGVQDTPEGCVRVNYFGAVATLEGLRPLLARGTAPRAVATCSSSVLNENSPRLVAALVAGDEEDAVAASVNTGLAAYPSSKRALARWIRRTAPTSGWAGVGIGLNAVAPGVVETAMTAPLLVDPAMVELIEAAVPMPHGGIAQPGHVADLIAYLTSPNSARICGQVVFVDGGADVVLRGEDIW
jgi:NAD(P)-dependent dehydrogenase (short-subunit alcohol dehydrogenase family)